MIDFKIVFFVEGVSVDIIFSGVKFIVCNIGFIVVEGEIVCIVGEFGFGKFVILMVIMGLLFKDVLCVIVGRILLDGEDILIVLLVWMCELCVVWVVMVF